MKKLSILLFAALLLVSCISTNIEYYSGDTLNGNKVFMQLDQSVSSVDSASVGYTTGYGLMFFGSSSETVKLGTIKNKETIKKALENKGYQVVDSIDEANIIMVGESSSNGDYSKAILGFYDKSTHELMFICEGKYGFGWNVQDDLNKAVKKALESVPAAK